MADVSSLRFLARYCKPRFVKNGMPKKDAFLIRPDEEYLSVNVMPGDLGMEAGLAQVRRMLAKKQYGTSPNGRLVAFNAGRIIRYLREYGGVDARIEHKPSPAASSHAVWEPGQTAVLEFVVTGAGEESHLLPARVIARGGGGSALCEVVTP